MCVLKKKLYGERDARVVFGDLFSSVFMRVGFERSPQQPQLYFHRQRRILTEMHQHDVHAAGPDLDLIKLKKDVGKHIRVKWSGLLGAGISYSFLKPSRTMACSSLLTPSTEWALSSGSGWSRRTRRPHRLRRADRPVI